MASKIIIIAVLIMFSAFFSATETAFSSLNKTRIKTLVDKGNKSAKLAYSLVENYDKLISTILIGNNIVNIASASVATILFVELYGDIGATISTVAMTIIVLIFGEITPKSIAKDCPEKFAMFSAPIMKILMAIFYILNLFFSAWKKLVSKLFRLEKNDKMSQEELLTLVDEVKESGSIDDDESELLHNAIEFTECVAQDILTHRLDLEAVNSKSSKEEIAEKFTQSKYSRLLMYKETIDNIIGVIHIKDFYSGKGITNRKIEDILTPVVFVTLKASIIDILHSMQEKKVHVAVVVDEYGGTAGIITMEDILEELVGDIWDEHDEVTEEFKKLDNNKYRVDASIELEKFFEFFDIKADEEEATLNSWVVNKINKIPQVGDKFNFDCLNIKVSVTSKHRLICVDVTKINNKQ